MLGDMTRAAILEQLLHPADGEAVAVRASADAAQVKIDVLRPVQ